MRHYKTITEYCKGIQIAAPKHSHFDIRTFEENMPLVTKAIEPFRHELYAIAIKSAGGGTAYSGHQTNTLRGSIVFFNTPYQLLSWDIDANWKGYYIMFSQEFLTRTPLFSNLQESFPFLTIDKTTPFEIDKEEESSILEIYRNIHKEYHSIRDDKFRLIESYTHLLLTYIRRYFFRIVEQESDTQTTSDVRLFSKFQTLIQSAFSADNVPQKDENIHSPAYFASHLHVHPHHLNAVVKRVTGKTTLHNIQTHIINVAKSYLIQTQISIKEIAYHLHFESPNTFTTLFKKLTSTTPLAYRKSHKL